jgi:hypothetical protein
MIIKYIDKKNREYSRNSQNHISKKDLMISLLDLISVSDHLAIYCLNKIGKTRNIYITN